ncbi:hypothetical protein B5Z22_19495 [Bacillus velezensis]|nr:hypothetical protein B5Z20_19465 [Bacillus velezensis]OQV46170.1 hypothetical protein B5Z22_19495 [Bacillus velezensis]OQV56946.1 hypothetical protein B5Z23_19495 [Bacillus velezensis]
MGRFRLLLEMQRKKNLRPKWGGLLESAFFIAKIILKPFNTFYRVPLIKGGVFYLKPVETNLSILRTSLGMLISCSPF